MRSEQLSSSFTKIARNSYWMFIVVAIGLIVFQVCALIYGLNPMPFLALVISLGFLAGCAFYAYTKGKRYCDVEADGKNIVVRNRKLSISFTVAEISTIQTLGTGDTPMPLLTKITLHEEKDGYGQFEFLAVDNGYEERYLFDPFVKAGGKIERRWVGFD